MFCPKCNAEYRPGFSNCVTCNVPLIEILPKGEHHQVHPEKRFVKILSTSDFSDVAVIKAALEAENIEYFFQGETMNILLPFIEPALLFVDKDKEERTIELLNDLKLNYFRLLHT